VAASLSSTPGGSEDRVGLATRAARLEHVDEHAGTEGRRLYYLATPPAFFGPIARGLGEVGQATPRSRIVIEKPFGDSLGSAMALTQELHRVFDESQVFRIDHYLGTETVQNLV